MRAYFALFLCLFTFQLQARVWQIGMKEAYVELEVDTDLQSTLSEGDQFTLNGHFCIRRSRPSKCQLLSPDDLSKYDVRFFYPDIGQEVTSQVSIVLKEDRHEFTFSAPAIKNSDKPQLIAQIENKGSKVTLYLRALTKIEELREKLLGHKTHWPKEGVSYIQKHLTLLSELENRLKLKLQGETALIAKREFPLQVKSNIAKTSSWSNAAEECVYSSFGKLLKTVSHVITSGSPPLVSER